MFLNPMTHCMPLVKCLMLMRTLDRLKEKTKEIGFKKR